MHNALFWYFSVPLRVLLCVCVCIRGPEFIRLTRVMVYPVGEDSLCRGLSICLRGRHASKTIYTNGGRDAGHCGGADAWRSAATCSHRAGKQGGRKGRQRETMSIALQFLFTKVFWRSFALTGHLATRQMSEGLVKTLNAKTDFLSQYGPYCDTTTSIRC